MENSPLLVPTVDGKGELQLPEKERDDPSPIPQKDKINVGSKRKNETAEASSSKGKKRALKSNVWDEFTRTTVNGNLYAQCKHCNKRLTGGSNSGTSHLRNHLNRCYMRQTTDQCNQSQKHLNLIKVEEGEGKMETWAFNQAKVRQSLAKAIIVHEYPLSIVEHEEFRNFMKEAQPKFNPMSRNTLKADIFKLHDKERLHLKDLLEGNKGRVAITSDMWTSGTQKRGYMAVTAHFIANDWTLQNRLLRFMFVPTPHTAEVLSDALIKSVRIDWDIDHKLSSLTADNCTTNDAMIEKLLSRIYKPSLLLEGRLFHMRCSAHVLNLIVKDGLDVIGEGIERIRDSVVYWSGTPKRWEKFEKMCQKLKIEPKKLVLDCRTRWNSTYLMINSAMPYREVFCTLEKHHVGYDLAPTDEDWFLAAEICEKLQVFFKVTKLFSGSKYPTTSLFFPKVCDISINLAKWMTSSNEVVRSMASKMIPKFDKYWSVNHSILAVATILDPRYKMKLIEFYFRRIYGDEYYMTEVEKVRGLLFELGDEYQRKNPSLRKKTSSSASIVVPEVAVNTDKDGLDEFLEEINSNCTNKTPRSDIEFYLEDGLVPTSKFDTFDVLAWWRTSGLKFPVLYEIARDVLAIPITSVASEAAFSTSGRLLEPYRSRLRPKTIEALMCCQSWIRNGSQANISIPTFQDDYDNDDGDDEESPVHLKFA